MSPLIFVLVMEYLTRILKMMSGPPDFKLHPMSKGLKLTHLIFAEDLMIFCNGDVSSIQRVMEALRHFNSATGLVANEEKSNIFLAGIAESVQAEILDITGFSEGSLPIRYLGLPLSSKKWGKMDCLQLVEKITHRITAAYSRNISYAGRLQIIKAVLFSIYNFWGAVFILPKSVLK